MSIVNRPSCLCQKALEKYEVDPGDICINCLRELSPDTHEAIYICLVGDCFYYQIANQSYYICEQCYNINDTMSNGDKNMDKVEYICNKVLSSLNIISYVFYV